MSQLKVTLAVAIAASLTMGAGSAADAKSAKKAAGGHAQMCQDVHALATGFGKENVTGFANSNLDLAINNAKDQLAGQGAKGFVVGKRKVVCEPYIDFGGSIGREHKCTASAQLCGKS